jgi:hypothetical protein
VLFDQVIAWAKALRMLRPDADQHPSDGHLVGGSA